MDVARQNFDHREFPMTDANFAVISSVAYEATGIVISEKKREMIYSRLSRRIRKLGLKNFDDYCELLARADSPEQSEFINAITTNLTAFFRESHHFTFLKETVLPELKQTHRVDRRIRIWSAGCSTGEEPYSIAMTVRESGFDSGWDVKILATDLDSGVLDTAKRGVYEAGRVKTLDARTRSAWFDDAGSQLQGETLVTVKPPLRGLITFKRLNLLEQWPMAGKFDVIFCRNVVIYFNKDTQRKLFDRYADILAPNGYLFIGHSENLNDVSKRFRSVGKTIYRKLC